MRVFCVIALGVAVLQGYIPSVRAELINGIQVVVHDSIVTRDEVVSMNMLTYDVLRRQYGNRPEIFEKKLAVMEHDNLETLVERQLVLHDFKTAGYSLPESVLDEIVNERIRARWSDRMQMVKSLDTEGVTYEKYRQQVRDDFIVQALRAKNVSQVIMISPHKVDVYYQEHKDDPEYKVEDRVKVRIIALPKSSDTNAPQAVKMAEEILSRLNDGVSFDEMAKEQGTDRSGERWFEKSELRKELADAAFALQAGQHSGVIDTADVCYLLSVKELEIAHTKPLSEVRDQIERDLLSAEQKRLEQQWVERLKKKTFVQYH